jgi:hypothetical protein
MNIYIPNDVLWLLFGIVIGFIVMFVFMRWWADTAEVKMRYTPEPTVAPKGAAPASNLHPGARFMGRPTTDTGDPEVKLPQWWVDETNARLDAQAAATPPSGLVEIDTLTGAERPAKPSTPPRRQTAADARKAREAQEEAAKRAESGLPSGEVQRAPYFARLVGQVQRSNGDGTWSWADPE